jgi:two-component system KDP operon response regulator KdpE
VSERPTVLVVEDELPIRRFLRPALEGAGYRLIEAPTLLDGRREASTRTPEVIVVDLGLPDGDGLDLIREVREWASVPILVLSARDREHDKVGALDLGADDYLTKPFGVGELLARLRVALRHRSRARLPEASRWSVGALEIDFSRRRVTLSGEKVQLTPIEYRLLSLLAKNSGRVLTHRVLLRDVWGPARDEPHLVRVHLANLRRKLERDTARPRYLLTEPGVGYRLADE